MKSRAEILDYIVHYRNINGYYPKMASIDTQFGFKRHTAYKRIVRMAESGLVEREEDRILGTNHVQINPVTISNKAVGDGTNWLTKPIRVAV